MERLYGGYCRRGALTLARHEFQSLEPLTWSSKEEFVLDRFQKYCTLFSSNWWLHQPLANDFLRTTPLEQLDAQDLEALSEALEAGEACPQWSRIGYFRPNQLLGFVLQTVNSSSEGIFHIMCCFLACVGIVCTLNLL